MSLQDGYVIPTLEDIRGALRQLADDIEKDPALQVRFKTSPSEVLGERGLGLIVQQELISESADTAGTIAAGCNGTCLSTNCTAFSLF
jgi:hypothetical protein